MFMGDINHQFDGWCQWHCKTNLFHSGSGHFQAECLRGIEVRLKCLRRHHGRFGGFSIWKPLENPLKISSISSIQNIVVQNPCSKLYEQFPWNIWNVTRLKHVSWKLRRSMTFHPLAPSFSLRSAQSKVAFQRKEPKSWMQKLIYCKW